MRNEIHLWLLVMLCAAVLSACREPAPQALGTLEWDRIALPAPAAEKIVRLDVHEGQQVAAGARLMQLEAARTRSQLDALQAQAQQSREALSELESGPRSEAIAKARASLAATQAQAAEAGAYYARLRPLGKKQLVAAAEVDRARASAESARAQMRVAQQALLELEHGTRNEQVAQGRSALAAAEAQASTQALSLQMLDVVAPRAGRIDSIPFKLGDQAPVGAALAILLVGDAPHARIYIPEPLRAEVKVGDSARVSLNGRDRSYVGKVRMIRSEPSFTPYYALTGDDAARLSFIAEIQLQEDAADLPAGLPVRVEFGTGP